MKKTYAAKGLKGRATKGLRTLRVGKAIAKSSVSGLRYNKAAGRAFPKGTRKTIVELPEEIELGSGALARFEEICEKPITLTDEMNRAIKTPWKPVTGS